MLRVLTLLRKCLLVVLGFRLSPVLSRCPPRPQLFSSLPSVARACLDPWTECGVGPDVETSRRVSGERSRSQDPGRVVSACPDSLGRGRSSTRGVLVEYHLLTCLLFPFAPGLVLRRPYVRVFFPVRVCSSVFRFAKRGRRRVRGFFWFGRG